MTIIIVDDDVLQSSLSFSHSLPISQKKSKNYFDENISERAKEREEKLSLSKQAYCRAYTLLYLSSSSMLFIFIDLKRSEEKLIKIEKTLRIEFSLSLEAAAATCNI
jgi:hypothetical protein